MWGTHNSIQLPDTVIRSLLGRGLSGDINGSMGRIKNFNLGPFEFNNMITSFPDSIAIGDSFKSNLRQGNLGGDILSRFKVTFNYSQNYMILQKQSTKPPRFNFNMSGIELIAGGDDLKTFIIENVRTNSPAAREGLQIGDELIMINSKDNSSYNLSNLNALFQSKPGRTIKLKIRRGKTIIKKSIVLEKML